MRGSYLHNHILLDPIEEHFRLLGARTRREHPTRKKLAPGFVDLFIEWREHRIVCEAELSARRVLWDLEKAKALDATLLVIVVPRRVVAEAAWRRVKHSSTSSSNVQFWILPLGPALQRLRSCFPLFVGANGRQKTNNKRPATPAERAP